MARAAQPESSTPAAGGRPALCLALLLAVFCALCLPKVIETGSLGYEHDEAAYHVPAIRSIVAKWPSLDLQTDTYSAIAPGYYFLLATTAQVTGDSLLALRLTHFTLCLLPLILLFQILSRRFDAVQVTLLCSILVFSKYYVAASCWISTDAPVLSLIIVTLYLAIRPQPTATAGLAAALATCATVMIRQLHIWLTVAPALRGMLELLGLRSGPSAESPRAGRTVWLTYAAGQILALGALAALVWHWGGLVPPQWRNAAQAAGLTVVPLVFVLALTALFLPFLHPGLLARLREPAERPWVLGAVCLGVALVLIQPNATSHAAGRWGGNLWIVASALPSVAERSPVFLLLAPFGAALTVVWLRDLLRRTEPAIGWALVGTYAAWCLTCLPNRQIFQRYYEPVLLVFAAIFLVARAAAEPADRPLRTLPLLGVAVVQLVVALVALHGQTLLSGIRNWQRANM